MDVRWQRLVGSALFALLPTLAIFSQEIASGQRDVLAMMVVLLLVFLVTYRAWTALGVARWRRQKQPGA